MGKDNSFSGKGIFPSKYAFTLLLPGRKLILSPKKLIRQIKPERHSRILEVGPGPGYFSVDVARAIPDGKLILFDIQQKMLDKAGRRLKKKGIKNVELVKSDGHTFPFPDEHFDIIFMVTVLGEVDEKETYLREFERVLKKGGRIVISEQKGDPDIMREEDLEEMFSKEGFRIKERFGNRLYYTLVFE
jgi:ubiquinone/menaquinone biosynthesis C-methylase UbiE